MFKPLTILSLLVASGCAGRSVPTTFEGAYLAESLPPGAISLRGTMDTTGMNFYSLIEPSGTLGSARCIPLILSLKDQRRARRLHGHAVAISGDVFFLGDIDEMIPDELGTVNGRAWTGTQCASSTVIFVHRLSAASAAVAD